MSEHGDCPKCQSPRTIFYPKRELVGVDGFQVWEVGLLSCWNCGKDTYGYREKSPVGGNLKEESR